ncbi:MAG: MarR family transcriptional regulator [Verrucomicrobia bacterium]|nr:MarR family transcriptional regulator [Verrucomicrobiota bacterium]
MTIAQRKTRSSRAPRGRALPIDAPERRRLPPLLRRAWYSLNQAFRRRIARTGMTPDQFTVVRTLLEAAPEGITQSELSQQMSSDPNTVAALVERMEKAGWIERQPHETDRRAHRLRVSPAGQRLYAEARDVAIALQTQVLSALPASEREDFLEHLSIIADACRLAADDSPKKSR